jgi:trimethylamine--corrinoid protein Co-methyltransferase
MLYATLLYSDKCLMGIPGNSESVQTLMDMTALVFGGAAALSEKPRIITLINTTSPLQLDRTALSTMLVCARHRQPLIISPGPIAGATGPISLAGNIVLGNA